MHLILVLKNHPRRAKSAEFYRLVCVRFVGVAYLVALATCNQLIHILQIDAFTRLK